MIQTRTCLAVRILAQTFTHLVPGKGYFPKSLAIYLTKVLLGAGGHERLRKIILYKEHSDSYMVPLQCIIPFTENIPPRYNGRKLVG